MSYDPRTYWPDRYRRQGDTYVAKGGRQDSHADQLAAIAPYFDYLPVTGRVLDYGCGPGRFRPALEARGLEYGGVDLIPGLGTLDTADTEPGAYDAAVALFVLQHITDRGDYRDAVRAVHGALRDGGRLLAVDHIADGRDFADHMNPRGPDGLKFVGWSGYTPLGTYNDHWVGLWTK